MLSSDNGSNLSEHYALLVLSPKVLAFLLNFLYSDEFASCQRCYLPQNCCLKCTATQFFQDVNAGFSIIIIRNTPVQLSTTLTFAGQSFKINYAGPCLLVSIRKICRKYQNVSVHLLKVTKHHQKLLKTSFLFCLYYDNSSCK